MRSWRSDRDWVVRCNGRVLHALMKEGMRVVCGTFMVAALAAAQSSKPVTKKTVVHRANEFLLAGLRPGRDTLARATVLYKKADAASPAVDSQVSWTDKCRHERLTLDYDNEKKVQVIRVTWLSEYESTHCAVSPALSSWKTGLGLRVQDSTEKLVQLYGPADSKSPSTRDGQPLELWYYAFDWAGPEVPQVMEVLCTREKEGQPGRVVEITLAAPSL